MKPIEPGCLALVHGLVVNTEFNGMCLEVVRRGQYGEIITDSAGNLGICGGSWWLCTKSDWPGVELFDSINLLRVDGHEPEAADTTTDEEVTA